MYIVFIFIFIFSKITTLQFWQLILSFSIRIDMAITINNIFQRYFSIDYIGWSPLNSIKVMIYIFKNIFRLFWWFYFWSSLQFDPIFHQKPHAVKDWNVFTAPDGDNRHKNLLKKHKSLDNPYIHHTSQNLKKWQALLFSSISQFKVNLVQLEML